MANQVAALRSDLRRIPEVGRIPDSVTEVCEVIKTQFADTANRLEDRATALEGLAAQLRVKANKIRTAGDNVPKNLKDWISTEIEYRDDAFKVGMVNPDPDYQPG